ncbi:hypothetical protein WDW37_05435 [Bdellovibrionota bacterium FG-1]
MFSKKLMSSLLLGSMSAACVALTSGCQVTVDGSSSGIIDTGQYVSLEANVFDYNGMPLDYPFDYYLDLFMKNGDHLVFHMDRQQTDVNGVWRDDEKNLQVFVDNGGVKCYDSCVSYDAYGCTVYATDCYDSSYSAQLDTNAIYNTSATIGIDTGYDYVAFQSSFVLSSYHDGSNRFVQKDEFDTNVLVLPSYIAPSPGGKPSKMAKIQGSLPGTAKLRGAKPVVITDLSKLTPSQKERLNQNRKHLHLPVLN